MGVASLARCAVVLACVGTLLAGCGGAQEPAETLRHASRAVERYPGAAPLSLGTRSVLMPTPQAVVRSCQRAAELARRRTLCPSRLPRAVLGLPLGFPPAPVYTRDLDLERTGSPDFHTGYGHLPGWRGGPCCSLHFGVYLVPDGERSPDASKAVVGGKAGWLLEANGRGEFWGNHLRFYFRELGQTYVASLHAFGPSTRQLLDELVASLRPPGLLEPGVANPADIHLGGAPTSLEYAFGSIWTTTTEGGLVPRGALLQVSPRSMRVTRRISLGESPVEVTAAGGVLLVAHQARSRDGARSGGAVSGVSPRGNRIIRTRVVFPHGRSRGIAARGERAWMIDGVGGQLVEVDPRTLAVTWRLEGAARAPAGIASTRSAVWITDFAAGEVVRIDPRQRRVVSRTPVGGAPTAIVATETSVWVADTDGGAVVEIDALTARVIRRVRVGVAPYTLTYADERLFVAGLGDGTVAVLDKDARLEAVHLVGGDILGLSVGGDAKIYVGVSSDRLVRAVNQEG